MSQSKKGIKLSENHKVNIRKSIKRAYKEGRRKPSFLGKENKWGNHSQLTKIKISAFQQGINSKDWKGFKVSKNRLLKNTLKYQDWRNKVFTRDNYTCRNNNCKLCCNEKGISLHSHHIKPLSLFPDLAFDIDNGITYCQDFHLKSGLHRNMRGGQNL